MLVCVSHDKVVTWLEYGRTDSLPLCGSRTVCWVHSWGPKFQFNYSPLQTSGPEVPCYQAIVNTWILEQEIKNYVQLAREIKNLTISSVTSWHENICPCCRNRACDCILSTHVRTHLLAWSLREVPWKSPLPRRVRLYDFSRHSPSASFVSTA